MSDKITSEEFDTLMRLYQNSGDTRLDRALEALLDMKSAGEISEDLAIKMMKFLISKQITNNIKADIRDTDARYSDKNKTRMRFIGFRYGRTEEHFAI